MTPAEQIALLRDALKNAAVVIDRMSYCPKGCDCYPCSTRDAANAALATAAPEQPKPKPVARLTHRDHPTHLFDVVILDRASCHDDMPLYAAPQQERDRDAERYRHLLSEIDPALWQAYRDSHDIAIAAASKDET